MLQLKDLSSVIASMDGLMPQSSRALLAHRLLKVLATELFSKLSDEQRQEINIAFLKGCNLRSGLPHVPADMNVHETDLAAFCNRWMNVEQYREPGGEFKPITPEMHSIRYTIVRELKALHESQKEQEKQESQG